MKSTFSMIVVCLVCAMAVPVLAGPFASQVVDYSELGDTPYNDPSTALGEPTRTLFDSWSNATMGISMVYGAWTPDAVVSIKEGGHLTVKFGQPITNDPLHPYGADLIVYGNSFFTGKDGWVEANTDMAAYRVNSSGAIFAQGSTMKVSVSRDGQTWWAFPNTFAGGYWPTQAFSRWDAAAGAWDQTSVSDFTKPMNPSLQAADFGALTVTDALALYGGSGGGTAFDIGELGLDWVQYVKVEGKGNLDAFAAVRPVPEPATIMIVLLGGGMLVARIRRR